MGGLDAAEPDHTRSLRVNECRRQLPGQGCFEGRGAARRGARRGPSGSGRAEVALPQPQGYDDADVTALTAALTSGSSPSVLRILDLSDNDIASLPLALLDLRSLTEINLSGNPRLGAVEQIAEEEGVKGVFDHLRDLYDDPQEEFTSKVLFAGPSMAGKSSLLRGLMRKATTLTAKDERTIGLEIERLKLKDPQGRALIFLVYDAGGHDEYQVRHRHTLLCVSPAFHRK